MTTRNKNQSGFTLIEMLVVISIIGIIATIGLIGLNRARTQGRDAKRISDIAHIQNELELYRATHNAYPVSNAWWASTDSTWATLATSLGITSLPVDPVQISGTPAGSIFNGAEYGYAYYSGNFGGCKAGNFYVLVFKQERLTINSPGGHWCDGATGAINYNTVPGAQNNITNVMGAP